MRRQSFLAITSLTLVAVAGTAVLSEAVAQEVLNREPIERAPVPVTFGTDPGAAHPRYAQQVAYAEASAGPAALSYAAPSADGTATPYAQDPIHQVAQTEGRSGHQVTVQAGDTVYGIARRFGVSPSALIEANRLAAPYTLSLGQALTIPPGQLPATQVAAAPARPAVTVAAPAPTRAEVPRYGAIERVEDYGRAASRARRDADYAVRPGDTLFGLARKFGVPVATLAAANEMSAPYTLSLGQRLTIPQAAPATPIEAPRRTATDPFAEADAQLVAASSASRFAWPIRGVVVQSYGMSEGGVRNDGINIAAPHGAPVRAAADGEVVYKGDELEGYGNLLLVRHEDGWVSAYAHTDTITVKKGDRVRQGQVVAKVGQSGSVDAPQLHFELRHDLKPQDPIKALGGDGVASTAVRF